MVPHSVVLCDIIHQVFLSLFSEYVENDFFVFCLSPNRISCVLLWIFLVLELHLRCCFLRCYPFPPILVVVSSPVLLVKFKYSSPLCFRGRFYDISNYPVLDHFTGALILSVFWIFVRGKISTWSASCLWFWYVGCIQIYMGNHYASSILCYCVWIWLAVI